MVITIAGRDTRRVAVQQTQKAKREAAQNVSRGAGRDDAGDCDDDGLSILRLITLMGMEPMVVS